MVTFNRYSRWRVPFPARLAVARLRARLVRRRRMLRATVALFVASALLVLGLRLDDGRAARARWGDVATVVMATAAAPAGGPVEAAAPELVVVPDATLVDDALRSPPADDARLRLGLRPGEIVTDRHLASGGDDRLTRHERAIAVPVDEATPALDVGDDIELVLLEPYSDADDPRAIAVAGRVVEPGEGAVLVAIGADAVGRVAATMVTGAVIIARR